MTLSLDNTSQTMTMTHLEWYLSQEAILQPWPYVELAATQVQSRDLSLVPDHHGSETEATNQLARPRAPPNFSYHVW